MSSDQHPNSANQPEELTPVESDTTDPESDDRPVSWRDRIIPFSALGIVVILICIFAYTLYTPSGSSLGAGGRVNTSGNAVSLSNREAPDFTLQTFEGETVSLADYRGKDVVINFWASWCPPCRDEAPMLNEFHEKAQENEDEVLLGVAIWDDREDSLDFMDQYNLNFTNLSDDDGSVLIDYGVYGIPETYFVNEEGILVGKYAGPLESAEQIDELQAEFEQESAQTD